MHLMFTFSIDLLTTLARKTEFVQPHLTLVQWNPTYLTVLLDTGYFRPPSGVNNTGFVAQVLCERAHNSPLLPAGDSYVVEMSPVYPPDVLGYCVRRPEGP